MRNIATGTGGGSVLLLLAFIGLFVVDTAAIPGATATGAGQSRRVPFGYDPRPAGRSLRLRIIGADGPGPGFSATIANDGPRAVSELTFVAIVETLGVAKPVRILTSQPWSLSLGVGQTADVTAPWLTSSDIDLLQSEAARYRVQMFLVLGKVRYSDGSEWVLPPLDPAATNHMDAMRQTALDIPRSLLSPGSRAAAGNTPLCMDDRKGTYSPGAIVWIRQEPGHRALCVNGQWVEQAAAPPTE